jgi:hypothetical protein
LCFGIFGEAQNNLDRSFFGVARLEGVDEANVTLLMLVGVPTLLSPQSLLISELFFFFLRLPKKPSFPMSDFHTNPRENGTPMSVETDSTRVSTTDDGFLLRRLRPLLPAVLFPASIHPFVFSTRLHNTVEGVRYEFKGGYLNIEYKIQNIRRHR